MNTTVPARVTQLFNAAGLGVDRLNNLWAVWPLHAPEFAELFAGTEQQLVSVYGMGVGL